jgi:hypothetical protein
MEGQKQEGKSRRAKVGAKNERVEQEFEGNFLPFFWFFLLFFYVFCLFCI